MHRRICFSQHQSSSAVARKWGLHLMYQIRSGDFITLIPITSLEQDTWWNLTHKRPPYHTWWLQVSLRTLKWLHWLLSSTTYSRTNHLLPLHTRQVLCIIKDAWQVYGPRLQCAMLEFDLACKGKASWRSILDAGKEQTSVAIEQLVTPLASVVVTNYAFVVYKTLNFCHSHNRHCSLPKWGKHDYLHFVWRVQYVASFPHSKPNP